MEGYLKIGKTGKPVGLKGFLSISLVTGDRSTLNIYDRLFLYKNNSLVEYEIKERRTDKPEIVKLFGVDTRGAADIIKGFDVYVSKEDIGELEEGEYYLADLVGLDVYENEVLKGRVISVNNYGASDIIDVSLKDGGNVMLPLIEDVLKEVNIKEKKISVENIDDYI
jgi:16S rRNA processing protein RimM